MSQPTIPFSALRQNPISIPKSDPLPQRTIEVDPVDRMKPPTVIPLNSLPPSVAPMFHALAFSPLPTQSPSGFVPNVKSWPPAGSSRNQPLQQLPSWPMAASLRYQQAPMRMAQFTRTPTPEDLDDYKDSEGSEGGPPDRNNRRREMNRLAQQKSRLRKDQLRASLQSDNDGLRAKIISLEAEVRVWKNMTKKSENEANELRRKVEEAEAKLRALTADESIKTNGQDRSESVDGLKIDEEAEENVDVVANDEPKVFPMATAPAAPAEEVKDEKYEDMSKEIELLTQELQRMYHLTAQQAEAQKLLHQALEDQQQRMSLLEKRKNDKVELQFCPAPSQSVTPVSKAGIRWKQRVKGGRISKRDIEKIATLLKKNKSS